MKSKLHPKVLLACPISQHKDYCLHDWFEYVSKLDYDFDCLFVDNSKDPNYHLQFKEKYPQWRFEHIEPKGNLMTFIAQCQERIRIYALNNKYDHLFMHECDVFARDRDIIIKLIAHNLDIVSGWYFIGFGDDTGAGILKLDEIWTDRKGTPIVQAFPYTLRDTFENITGQLISVYNAGIGCTMISQDMLRKIRFRSEGGFSSDSVLALDLMKKQIPNICDTSLFCEHRNMDWQTIPERWVKD